MERNPVVVIAFLILNIASTSPVQADPALTLPLGDQPAAGAPAFSPDGHYLACMDEAGTLHLYDLVNRKWHARLKDLRQEFAGEFPHWRKTAVAFSPDSSLIAASHSKGTRFAIWRVEQAERLGIQNAYSSSIGALTFSAKAAHLVTCGDEGTFKVWVVDPLKGVPAEATSTYTSFGCGAIAEVRPTSNLMAMSCSSNGFTLLDIATHKPAVTADLGGTSRGMARAVSFSTDGRQIAIAGVSAATTPDNLEGLVMAWDIERKAPIRRVLLERHLPHWVSFSANGRTLAISWKGPTGSFAELIEVASGKMNRKIINTDFAVFSQDGQWLCSSGAKGLQMWRLLE